MRSKGTGASIGGASVTGPKSKAEILCRFLGLGASALVAPRPVPSSAAACCERGRARRQQPPVISSVHAGSEEFSDGNAAWFHAAVLSCVEKISSWQIKCKEVIVFLKMRVCFSQVSQSVTIFSPRGKLTNSPHHFSSHRVLH